MASGKITVQYTVWCGHPDCNVWDYVDGRTKTKAAKAAMGFGWKLTRAQGWLCPTHAVNPNATPEQASWNDRLHKV